MQPVGQAGTLQHRARAPDVQVLREGVIERQQHRAEHDEQRQRREHTALLAPEKQSYAVHIAALPYSSLRLNAAALPREKETTNGTDTSTAAMQHMHRMRR